MPPMFLLSIPAMLGVLVSPMIFVYIVIALSQARWHAYGKRAGLAGGLPSCFLMGICLMIAKLTDNERLDPRVLARAGGAGWTIGALGYVFWQRVRRRLSGNADARGTDRLPAARTRRTIELSKRAKRHPKSFDED